MADTVLETDFLTAKIEMNCILTFRNHRVGENIIAFDRLQTPFIGLNPFKGVAFEQEVPGFLGGNELGRLRTSEVSAQPRGVVSVKMGYNDMIGLPSGERFGRIGDKPSALGSHESFNRNHRLFTGDDPAIGKGLFSARWRRDHGPDAFADFLNAGKTGFENDFAPGRRRIGPTTGKREATEDEA